MRPLPHAGSDTRRVRDGAPRGQGLQGGRGRGARAGLALRHHEHPDPHLLRGRQADRQGRRCADEGADSRRAWRIRPQKAAKAVDFARGLGYNRLERG